MILVLLGWRSEACWTCRLRSGSLDVAALVSQQRELFSSVPSSLHQLCVSPGKELNHVCLSCMEVETWRLPAYGAVELSALVGVCFILVVVLRLSKRLVVVIVNMSPVDWVLVPLLGFSFRGCFYVPPALYSTLEYVPQPLAPTLPVFVENSLWFTNSFAMQAFSAEDNDLFDTRRMNFGQWKQRMSKKTSLAQKEEVIRRTVSEEQLAGLFQSCGQVVDCRICGDNKSILRLAFIEFTDEEGARAALSLSGTLFGSYPIQVRLSKTAIAPVNPSLLPKSEDERETCAKTVYCTNIDKKVTQMELEDFFKAACGEIQHVRLIGDCHHQTCIAFVEFKLVESAVSALNCSGIVLGCLPLR
ncbi:hypothetical protein YC2023_105399 [Brassica napus]